MVAQDQSQNLLNTVREACAQGSGLVIHGGETKQFYGRDISRASLTPLNTGEHRGVIHYEPTELVITARAGTPLIEIEHLLEENHQMLPFEPPHFGENSTAGGMVATGLSGPRRPYSGAVRDNILGVEIINGKGERLHFGGEVMKNVAGYDLARTMAGALGTLGVLLEVSLKVLPRPQREITLAQTLDSEKAITLMSHWANRPLPISATWHDGKDLYVRLSGGERSIRAAQEIIGGDLIDWSTMCWQNIQEQSDPFFMTNTPLWRLSVPPATPSLSLPGESVMEWQGALRWLKCSAPADQIRNAVSSVGGHATLFRGGDRSGDVFHPLPGALLSLHRKLKNALDPQGIFNPGRMYPEL